MIGESYDVERQIMREPPRSPRGLKALDAQGTALCDEAQIAVAPNAVTVDRRSTGTQQRIPGSMPEEDQAVRRCRLPWQAHCDHVFTGGTTKLNAVNLQERFTDLLSIASAGGTVGAISSMSALQRARTEKLTSYCQLKMRTIISFA